MTGGGALPTINLAYLCMFVYCVPGGVCAQPSGGRKEGNRVCLSFPRRVGSKPVLNTTFSCSTNLLQEMRKYVDEDIRQDKMKREMAQRGNEKR